MTTTNPASAALARAHRYIELQAAVESLGRALEATESTGEQALQVLITKALNATAAKRDAAMNAYLAGDTP